MSEHLALSIDDVEELEELSAPSFTDFEAGFGAGIALVGIGVGTAAILT
jgi:hypothetical protein